MKIRALSVVSGLLFVALGAGAQEVSLPAVPQIDPSLMMRVQEGTWAHVVKASSLVESHLDAQGLGDADGIDAEFMAEASVHASQTVRGPDLCEGTPNGVSDLRVIGMKVFSKDVPFLSGEQESRLIVNQEQKRAVLYLHGDVREWGPGPNYCDDGRLVETASGRGLLRLEYETQSHVAPLNFQAHSRSWELDEETFAELCQRIGDSIVAAYGAMGPKWATIPVQSPPGPIDTSILIPKVPEGANNGEQASFADGFFNTQAIYEGVSDAYTAADLLTSFGPFLARAPHYVKGGAGLAAWGIGYVASEFGAPNVSDILINHYASMLPAVEALKYDPHTRHLADYANQPLQFGGQTYSGLDADYLSRTMLEICAETELPEPISGYAAGFFSRPGGWIPLFGRGPIAGVPAAVATGPVTGGDLSLEKALEMARAMGATDVPSLEELQAQLPEGVSLDGQPIHMSGTAGSGPSLAPGLQEWTLSYFVELAPEGEKIAKGWFDPKK